MLIRKAGNLDINTIAEFNINLAKETENLDLNKDSALKGAEGVVSGKRGSFCYICEIDNIAVGQIIYTKEWSDWDNGYYLWIQSVYIREEYRKIGAFRALYNEVYSIAEKEDDVIGLRLYVDCDNEKAQNVYKKLGMNKKNYYIYELKGFR